MTWTDRPRRIEVAPPDETEPVVVPEPDERPEEKPEPVEPEKVPA
jgi:hypothetical protein